MNNFIFSPPLAVIGRDNRRISNVQQPIGANRDFQGGAGMLALSYFLISLVW